MFKFILGFIVGAMFYMIGPSNIFNYVLASIDHVEQIVLELSNR